MITIEELKTLVYDDIVERERVLSQASQAIQAITDMANGEVERLNESIRANNDKINTIIDSYTNQDKVQDVADEEE